MKKVIQRSEISGQRSAVRDQRSEISGQRSAVRVQSSEISGQSSAAICLLTSVFCLLTSVLLAQQPLYVPLMVNRLSGEIGSPAGLTNRIWMVLTNAASLLTAPTNSPVETLGYYAPGDGGGNKFVWYPGDTTLTNPGTVWNRTGLVGRWKAVKGKVFDLRQFGADPTASNDIRNAFQAALNEASAVKGTVLASSGKYRLNWSKPLHIGYANIRGEGGQIWCSLPDGYVNPNNYSTQEVYSVANQLDRFGNMVTWSPTNTYVTGYEPAFPWNGKSLIFEYSTNSLVENLWLDAGWGTTNAPGSVRPITGIQPAQPGFEFTYYQVFNHNWGTTFRNNWFWNTPGDFIEFGANVTAIGNFFGNYGDHVFYFGYSGRNIKFQNNVIIAARPETGTPGNVNYVAASDREAIKFRACTNVMVEGNIVLVPQGEFASLETHSSVAGGMDLITFQVNLFRGGIGLSARSYRRDDAGPISVAGGHTGHAIRGLVVKNNTFDLWGHCFRSSYYHTEGSVALDSFEFTGNTILAASNTSAHILLGGNPDYVNAIRYALFSGNTFITAASYPLFDLQGNIDRLDILNNHFLNSTTTRSLIAISGSYQHRFGRINIMGNRAENYSEFYADGDYGIADWASGFAYTFTTNVLDDFSRIRNFLVKSANLVYTNRAAVTSATAPGTDTTNWGLYIKPVLSLNLINNEKLNTFSSGGGESLYLVSLTGANNRQAIALEHARNRNRNTIGAPIAYGVGASTDATITVTNSSPVGVEPVDGAATNLATYATVNRSAQIWNDAGTNVVARFDTNGNFQTFVRGGATNLFAGTNGTVGVGAASPDAKLHVYGDALFGTTSTRVKIDDGGRILAHSPAANDNLALGGKGSGGVNFGYFSGPGITLYDGADNVNSILGGAALADTVFGLLGGKFGVGDATPVGHFTVGPGDKFQIDTNGQIMALAGTAVTITAGSAAPSSAEPDGSLYLRSNGAFYVRTNSDWLMK